MIIEGTYKKSAKSRQCMTNTARIILKGEKLEAFLVSFRTEDGHIQHVSHIVLEEMTGINSGKIEIILIDR